MSTERLGDVVARWTVWAARHPAPVLSLALLATVFAGGWAVRHLSVDSDTGSMISERLPWRQAFLAYEREFPQLGDEIQVVIEADTPEAAEEAQWELGRRLRARPTLYRDVYLPRGGPFFEQNGLLYLETSQLEDLASHSEALSEALVELEAEPSLAVLMDVLVRALSERSLGAGESAANVPERLLFEALGEAIRGQVSWQRVPVSWRRVLGAAGADSTYGRRFVVLSPELDYSLALPAESAMEDLRAVTAEVSDRGPPGLEIHITGSEAIEHEALRSAVDSTRRTGLFAVLLITFILYLGLGSGRLAAVSLITLLVGLTWTAAFAALSVGSLNMVSIAFAVIYVGLGIDYAVHLSLGIAEAMAERSSYEEALQLTARRVGVSLVLSALTTAACFYAFLPADFSGVSQLGLIGGTGIFISLVATLTLLPALLALRPFRLRTKASGAEHPSANRKVTSGRLHDLIVRRRRPILICAGLLVAVSAGFASRVRFDQDPMNLSNPHSESMAAYRALRDDPNTAPRAISVLARGPDSVRALASRLRGLPEVRDVITPLELVPEDQETKLPLVRGIRIPPPSGGPVSREPGESAARVESGVRAIDRLQEALASYAGGSIEESAAEARSLSDLLILWTRWLGLWQPEMQARLVDDLEHSMVGTVSWDVRRLRAGLEAEAVGLSDLPAELRDRWIGKTGTWRIQVVPASGLQNSEALARFVGSVRTVVPQVTGVPVNDLESSRVAISAFWRAFMLGLLSVTLLLLLLLRSPGRAALVLCPLLASAVLTFGVAGALGLPMNFANIITLPLLLGVGVDNGIHVVHRMQVAHSRGENIFATSAARAVLVSTLTTLATFGSLSLSSHLGLASMGQLLAIGMIALLYTTLLVLPAWLSPEVGRPAKSVSLAALIRE
jgi:hopanoid biosynthesis associated RND transporter like protein HpnN